MTIYFYNGLARNLEIGNTLVWVLPNIWRLGQARDTKFDMNISNKLLLNTAKYQGCSFKGKPIMERECKITPSPLPDSLKLG